ncbi:DUF4397 domain-containing protein [Mucilaginibacter sp.]|uniref:DUF4397 domain-containing protein n=1 Tax=Mucilaginibacter sp. TaxID=1882438 RepID=UPI0026088369|nr:DUF4397 domain-containing protein [Mucilaginibacter sp.]MDB4921041.1 hypothetical protein [Mucilaginibacter sp.]
MANQHKNGLLVSMLLFTMGVLLLPFISSCGKGTNANASGLNTQLQILNLSLDAQPLNLYQNFVRISTTTYAYPASSGYFYLSTLVPPLQMRLSTAAATNILTINTTLKSNSKYTLFITGFRSDSSIKNSILSLDTVTLPSSGRGKVRFAHTSASSPELDLWANGTKVTDKQLAFNTLSPYVQLPAGNYIFTVTVHTTPTKIEATTPIVTIQDGRAYTIYTQGIVGRTDSAAFGTGVLTNNLLLKSTQ